MRYLQGLPYWRYSKHWRIRTGLQPIGHEPDLTYLGDGLDLEGSTTEAVVVALDVEFLRMRFRTVRRE